MADHVIGIMGEQGSRFVNWPIIEMMMAIQCRYNETVAVWNK
jgi:hypothetical protein